MLRTTFRSLAGHNYRLWAAGALGAMGADGGSGGGLEAAIVGVRYW